MTEFNRSAPGMPDLFPSSGRDIPRPREVTDVVHLVHPFPGQMLALENASRQSFTSAANVSPAIAFGLGSGPATQPAATYDELIMGHVGHTAGAGVTPVIRISVVDPTGTAIVWWIQRWDATLPGVAFIPLYGGSNTLGFLHTYPRPFLIPPGWQLQATGSTEVAAYTITVAYVAARRPLVDVPLFR